MISTQEVVCQNRHCNTLFTAKTTELKRGAAKYCCHLCSTMARTIPAEERFWAYVDRLSTPNGCWLWTGGFFSDGYGRLNVSKKLRVAAHRYSYELAYGPIPHGLYVCHTCDVHACVNPHHLFVGTQQDNLDDALRKGRFPVGEARANTKLKEHQVHKIITLRGSKRAPIVARQFGVSRMTISNIWNKKIWKHIE